MVVNSFVPYNGDHKSNNFYMKIAIDPFLLVSFLLSTGMGADPDPSFRFDADQAPNVHIDADPSPDPAPHQSDANLKNHYSTDPPRLHLSLYASTVSVQDPP
jgi:hypothetical protein